ncbi:MAG: phage head-tail connector protein [Erythrobacter sp.]|nr:phage head-tail connector protein [Erythrobacter sp.]
MRRLVVVPPVLAAEALDELKQWLAVTTTRDDAALVALLRAALETCEGYTRAMPLVAGCEEVLPASYEWMPLATAPVVAITNVEAMASDGTRAALPVDHYLIDITADGCGRLRLLRAVAETRLVVTFEAGIAPGWASLPQGLRHGVLRLAAHNYREREAGEGKVHPPAAVAALWQPWRRMRLA